MAETSVATVQTVGLGKQFGPTWALKDCSITIPPGRVTALVGPNGAGKTTLLRLLVGLSTPTTGEAMVLGATPTQSAEYLGQIGYLAQDVPLYKRLSASDHLEIGAHLNRRWEAAGAIARLRSLNVPLDRPVSTLSGGQRAQVGLGLALAKHPRLLLLDEPVAALDPLARREFLASLTEAVADGGLSVILSSHLLHDLERVCDHVLLLAASHTQLCEDIDEVVATHRMLVGPRSASINGDGAFDVIKATYTTNQVRLLVRLHHPIANAAFEVSEIGLEEIILAYMAQEQSWAEPSLVAVSESR